MLHHGRHIIQIYLQGTIGLSVLCNIGSADLAVYSQAATCKRFATSSAGTGPCTCQEPPHGHHTSLSLHTTTLLAFRQAFGILQEELGRPIAEVFSSISERPIAAASLGQVYKAVLRETSEEVAVKVQRPSVEPVIFRDLFIFRAFARLVNG